MLIEITYLVYLLISIIITVWVARSLSTNGLVFLVDGFGGNESLARSVNHLLVVGFYLVNLGFINLALRYGQKPVDAQTAMEFLSTKIGVVLLVVGLMHLFNVRAINNYRRRFSHDTQSRPATSPQAAASAESVVA